MKNKVYFGLVLFYIENTNHPFFFNVVEQAPSKPKDRYQSFERADIYVDWFHTAESMNDYKNMLIKQVYTDEKARLSKIGKGIVPIETFKKMMTRFSMEEAISRLKNKEKVYLIPPILTDRMFYHEIAREEELVWNSKKVSLKNNFLFFMINRLSKYHQKIHSTQKYLLSEKENKKHIPLANQEKTTRQNKVVFSFLR